ncbi:hypothetical protein AWM70_05330 [Paenibacillus yonginensis]|uniref:Uncharacterized protein n=1 Tax=Paenibacillus yonginensis TaxID=1462996 RepID=A0A1B1MY33_9BACL|nr:hypothetical protein [Paenibacillus yonginensis]ANS74067.1 hypothetical protein AWM70_05330 [Paenibacillus yonginensis]
MVLAEEPQQLSLRLLRFFFMALTNVPDSGQGCNAGEQMKAGGEQLQKNECMFEKCLAKALKQGIIYVGRTFVFILIKDVS